MASKERRLINRKIATEFVESVNQTTFCNRCGAQPIEWHREEHEKHPNWRVSSLRTQGRSIARIKREMDLSEPLCRTCHMKTDGRYEFMQTAGPYEKGKTYTPPLPCIKCGRLAKPRRRERCNHCYIKYMGIR